MPVMLGASGGNISGTNAPYFDGTQVCAQIDPELFFPDNPAETPVKLRVVKPICNSCDFQAPCLEYAVANPELLGIWAGTTEKDRRELRRRTKRQIA